MELAQKQVTIAAANTPYSLSWNATDFQNHLGYGIIDFESSLGVSITNNCNQAVYVSLSYRTLSQDIDVIQRSALLAVGAGKTTIYTALSVSGLGSLQKDIISITVSFISQGTGTVICSLSIEEETTIISDASYIGAGVREAADYTAILRNAAFTLPAPTISYIPPAFTYAIPAGKRGYLTHFFIRIPPTPQENGQIQFRLLYNGLANSSVWSLQSLRDGPYVFTCSGPQLFALEAGDYLQPQFVYTNGFVTSDAVFMSMQITSMY